MNYPLQVVQEIVRTSAGQNYFGVDTQPPDLPRTRGTGQQRSFAKAFGKDCFGVVVAITLNLVRVTAFVITSYFSMVIRQGHSGFQLGFMAETRKP